MRPPPLSRRRLTAALGGLLVPAIPEVLPMSADAKPLPTTQKQYRLLREGAVTNGVAAFVLKQVDAAVRPPADTEVLVRVHATSLNRRDVMIAKGSYPLGPRDSLVPLSDGAGEVVAIGARVQRFRLGDRVAATFFQKWISGKPPAGATESALGGALDGMLSQYVTLDQEGLVKLPAGLSYEEGATLPCAAVTAWDGLVTRGRLQPGDYVLLQGTGGVSIFGLQIARAAGAKPVITSSSDAKLARARALGAVATINYRTTPDWDVAVRAATGDHGADQILEVGGAGTLPKSLASVAAGGQIAIIGGLSGFGGQVPVGAIMGRNASVSGIFVGSRADFEALNAFIERHHLKPVIDRVFEFDAAQAAYDFMDSDELFGKIVIRV
jgi:NADPH:quinone reductase-like Zn-dependent oxidoreductase